MGFTNYPNGVTSLGLPVIGGGGGVPIMFGDYWFVDFTNGLDGNNGKSRDKALKTLSKVHEKATTNNNDVVLINGGSENSQLSEMLTWTKNRIHVVGCGTFGAVDMQPEIQLSSVGNAADNAATIKVTGYGNTFSNLYITNAGTHGNSVAALWDAGENNVYTNCQFAKFSDLDETGVADVEARGDTTTWRNCKFGVDWVVQSVARPTLRIKGTGGSARMKHNIFEDCYFVCASSSTDKAFILIENNSSLGFANVMKNPIFYCALVDSLSAATLDNAIDSSTGLVDGNLLVINPSTNTSAFATTVGDQIQIIGPTTTNAAGLPQSPA